MSVKELTGESLLSLAMLSSETGTISDNLTGWKVSDVKSRKITIQLEFSRPLLVSQADKPDQLLIMINFGNFTDIKD